MTLRLVILDIPPETNAGDLARELGLLGLLRDHGYEQLGVSVVLGPNQLDRLSIDYPVLSSDSGIEILPVLRPTFFNDAVGAMRVVAEVGNALSLLLVSIGIPLVRFAPRFAKRLIPNSYRRTIEALEQADVVVWFGKNLRSRRSRLVEAYRVHSKILMPLVAIALRKPVVCLGASIWRLGSRPGGRMLGFVLRRCAVVSVRESVSSKHAHGILGSASPITEVPDLSLGILRGRPTRVGRSFEAGMKVSVTLVDWSEFGSRVRADYVSAMAGFVERLIGERGAEVHVVPQVVKAWETASFIIDDFLRAIRSEHRPKVNVIERGLDLDELFDQYRSSDLLLASRMHSAIFALGVGTPVLAVPYDVGSKWQIISDLGMGEFIVPYDRVRVGELMSRFDRVVDDQDAIMSRVRNKLDEHMGRLSDNLYFIESAAP